MRWLIACATAAQSCATYSSALRLDAQEGSGGRCGFTDVSEQGHTHARVRLKSSEQMSLNHPLLIKGRLSMRTDMSSAGRPAYYAVREAAWLLGVAPSTVSRALRLGTLRAVRRHGQLVFPASALIRLLAEPTGDGRGESR
jgi:hypothetical protein